jgi:hypothetical protein
MEQEENVVTLKWDELKVLVASLEFDLLKNARGTAAAGVRVRKGLRDLKNMAAELVKMTVTLDKAKKAAKPPKAPRVKKEPKA